MYFYDAIAPIVAADSIDWDHAFRGSRWGRDADAPVATATTIARPAATPASATTSTAR